MTVSSFDNPPRTWASFWFLWPITWKGMVLSQGTIGTNRKPMPIPFTSDQFFDVFGSYNESLWPFAVLLWLASLVALVRLVRGSQGRQRFINALLVTHWLWSAIAYHMAFFTKINRAAWLFGALFLIQALLFAWYGVIDKRLNYSTGRSLRHVLAGGLITYALIYPAIGWIEGFALPRMPTFGIPCPYNHTHCRFPFGSRPAAACGPHSHPHIVGFHWRVSCVSSRSPRGLDAPRSRYQPDGLPSLATAEQCPNLNLRV